MSPAQRPSLTELKQLWLTAYSRASLLQASDFLEAIPRVAPNSVERRAMICAAVVSYARPFTQSQVTTNLRVIPLAGVTPPPTLASAHETALNLRNKVMGHTDGTPAKGHAISPNIMLVQRDATGFNLHTILIGDMTDTCRTELLQLCDHFVQYCGKQAQPLIAKYGPEIMKNQIGAYQLVLTEPPNAWIAPFDPASGSNP